MFIQAIPSGPFSTNAYVVACAEMHEAAIVDPAPDSAAAIVEYLSAHQLIPKKILLTHSHWDHIAEVKSLKDRFHIPVYVHPLDAPNLQKPGADGLPCWLRITGVEPDGFFEEGEQFPVGKLNFQILHTPGHSPGSVCFYEPQQGVLISGDTLFKGTIGNLSFPTSQPSLMWSSLEKLERLPSNTRVYPGHGPATTIKEESRLLREARSLFDLE